MCVLLSQRYQECLTDSQTVKSSDSVKFYSLSTEICCITFSDSV